MENKCFACGKKLGIKNTFYYASTFDGQEVYVGSDCHKHISGMTIHGWQHPKGSTRLHCTMLPLCTCKDHWPWEAK